MKRVVFLATLMYSSATVFGMQGDKGVFSDRGATSSARMNMVQDRDDLSNRLSRQLLEKQLFESEQNKEKAVRDCGFYSALYEIAKKQDAVRCIEIYSALYKDAQKREQGASESIKTLSQLLESNSISGEEMLLEDNKITKESLGLKTSLDLENNIMTISSKDGEELALEFLPSDILFISESLRLYDSYWDEDDKAELVKDFNEDLSSLSKHDLSKMIQQASEDKKKAEDKSEDLSKKAVAYYEQLLDKNKELGLELKDRLNYFVKSVPEKEELFVTCVKKREAEKSMHKANIRYDALNKKLKEFTSQDY
ncbi:MAG: hypothetical protein K5766_01735 [Alphaproteobacteria bacterium]|nr:hypothetical protein [Alphaproteobacteria bacterium]